jgi:hypothetical protein
LYKEDSSRSGSCGLQVSTATVVVYPDPSDPTLSASAAMKSPDPQFPGPLASLVETAETTKKMERDSEPPAEDVQLQYYCDKLCSPNMLAFTEKYL